MGKIANPTRNRDKEAKIIFSFKYLDLDDPDFCIGNCEPIYFITLLNRISELSRKTVFSFQTQFEKSLRNHAVDWGDVERESFGIPNEEELVEQPWQFSLTVNEHGRVIGFFIGDVFYIVWLDCKHRLYS